MGQLYMPGSVTELAAIVQMFTGRTKPAPARGHKPSQAANIWIIELPFRQQKEWTSKQTHLPLICLPRKLCPGGLLFLSLRNSKATSTILLFGSIQNVARTVDRKFRKQQKINFGGGSAFLNTSFEADWDISIGLRWFSILNCFDEHWGSLVCLMRINWHKSFT